MLRGSVSSKGRLYVKSVPMINVGLVGLWAEKEIRKNALLRSEGIKVGFGLEEDRDYRPLT